MTGSTHRQVVHPGDALAFYFELPTWLLGLSLLILFLIVQRRRGRSRSYLLFAALLWVYLMLVAKATLFPIEILPRGDARMSSPFMSQVNLIPLYFGPVRHSPRTLFWLAAPNILLTVPFGFLISFVARLRARHFLWLPIAAGLSIESAQLVISTLLGYLYRVLDVNDLIFNTAGVVLGYLVFRLLAWLYRDMVDSLKLHPRGLAGYIYEVAARARVF